MSVRITGAEAALYDSVTGMAFGPVFKDEDEAEEFLEWYSEGHGVDLRSVNPNSITDLLNQFRGERGRA